ncbi:unnamed protein product [Protopolystoma xenopodis]|uniref:Uncharacterized protein n=1 Tax=Protopolystoma xenopodis TaxID=117903 RepID=A0A3S5CL74_9PLAT|nr:unnamed protein product [Protopolystoma xenopodis]
MLGIFWNPENLFVCFAFNLSVYSIFCLLFRRNSLIGMSPTSSSGHFDAPTANGLSASSIQPSLISSVTNAENTTIEATTISPIVTASTTSTSSAAEASNFLVDSIPNASIDDQLAGQEGLFLLNGAHWVGNHK